MNESVVRVTQALSAFGGDHRIVEFTEPARTAADAARLLGVPEPTLHRWLRSGELASSAFRCSSLF